MQSKLCLYYFSVCSLCSRASFCLQNVSKSGCLPRRASDLFYPRISLSLSPLSLVPNAHKHTHTRTHAELHTNGGTPLVPRRLLLKADEMKEQLAFFASSDRYSLADSRMPAQRHVVGSGLRRGSGCLGA